VGSGPSDGTLTDAVRRLQAGEPGAAEAFVARVEGPVRNSIRRRLPQELRRRVDSDDLFQSTITDAVAAIAEFEFRGEGQFLAWLDAIAARRVAEAGRHHRAQRRDLKRDASISHAGGVHAAVTAPAERVVRGETSARLRRAISALPADERRCIELRSFEEKSFGEIAQAMGLTDKTAARRLYMSALDRLAEAVDERSA
jgi:RNA polymerase sigma-70 factor (ECF subfamily)